MDEHVVQRVMSAKPAKNLSGKVVYAALYHELRRGKDVASQALATAKIDTAPSAFLRSEIGHVLAKKKRKEKRLQRRLAKKKRAARREARRMRAEAEAALSDTSTSGGEHDSDSDDFDHFFVKDWARQKSAERSSTLNTMHFTALYK